jgi:plastocyanin
VAVGALLLLGSPVAAAASSGGEPIALDGVEEIAISGGGTAVVAIGSPAELSISGPAGIADQLTVTVDDDELLIEPATEEGIDLGDGELRYTITVERLSDVRLGDGVSMEVDGLSGDELDIDLRDSTASLAGLELEDLDAEVRGSAMLRVTGTTDEVDVEASQSGAFDGTELAAATADVEARESARVVVNVSSGLEVEARDEAIVEYVGNPPNVEVDTRDSATVRQATGTLFPTAPPPDTAVPGTAATGSATATSPAAEPAALEVSMADRAFSPAVLEISVGDTVTWINDDDTEHTVTADDGAFDSGQLNEGATFSFTFDTPGEFAYHCQFHSEMQATIVVR